MIGLERRVVRVKWRRCQICQLPQCQLRGATAIQKDTAPHTWRQKETLSAPRAARSAARYPYDVHCTAWIAASAVSGAGPPGAAYVHMYVQAQRGLCPHRTPQRCHSRSGLRPCLGGPSYCGRDFGGRTDAVRRWQSEGVLCC